MPIRSWVGRSITPREVTFALPYYRISEAMHTPLTAIAIGAMSCALVLGCKQAPAPVVEEPGRAVIYPEGAQAARDIDAALATAAREKKRVLLDFGGNWCGDCQVLEIYFHDAANRALLEQNYVLVPVNIGRY